MDYLGSANTAVRFRLRASGSDSSSNYFFQYLDAANTTLTAERFNSQDAAQISGISSSDLTFASMDLYSPQIAAASGYYASGPYRAASSSLVRFDYAGGHSTATSYDGITLYPVSGTFTGVVRIYGYANS
jgi:hypothetical protein